MFKSTTSEMADQQSLMKWIEQQHHQPPKPKQLPVLFQQDNESALKITNKSKMQWPYSSTQEEGSCEKAAFFLRIL